MVIRRMISLYKEESKLFENGYDSSYKRNLGGIIWLVSLWKSLICKEESQNYIKNYTHL